MLTAAAGEPATPAEAPPSADLLMYLGEFEDAGGEFVDPMTVESTDPNALSDDTDSTPGNDEKSDEPAPHAA